MNLNPKPERQGTLRAIPKRRIITRRRENGLSYPSWPGLSKHTTCNLGCGSALTSRDQSINQSTRISHLNYEIITRCQARYLNCILHHVPNPKKNLGETFSLLDKLEKLEWRNEKRVRGAKQRVLCTGNFWPGLHCRGGTSTILAGSKSPWGR